MPENDPSLNMRQSDNDESTTDKKETGTLAAAIT
jgi:hypothetical protein